MKARDHSHPYIILVFFFLLSAKLSAQIDLKGNIESGFYKSMGDFLSDESDKFFAIEGKLGYNFKKENTEAVFELKARPEWFGLDNKLFSFKFRASGDLTRHEENFDWGVGVTRRLNHISGGNVDIDYDIFSVQANSIFYWFENMPLSFVFGYAYQNLASSVQQNHDIIFTEGKIHHIFSSAFRTGYGLYLEKFLIEGEVIENNAKRNESNEGLRLGPELEIYYLKDFVINGQYRLLFHLSGNSKSSYEHWIRLVAGKILFHRFSAFLLMDYYWRNINYPMDSGKIDILYSPFNVENNISLKISYELSGNLELYLKGGYFRNDLVYNNYMFEGWNFLLGLELSN